MGQSHGRRLLKRTTPALRVRVRDLPPAVTRFHEEVLEGLQRPRKTLPCKYFYDARGSRLFEKICDLEEYYLTRTELSIMDCHAAEMARALGPRCLLLEYGPGSGRKTRLLLDHLVEPAGYVPIDISEDALMRFARALEVEYPRLEVLPVVADYTSGFGIPEGSSLPSRRAVYFPGSTIGNFEPAAARGFLERAASTAGSGGGLLIGVDLRKDAAILEAAYDDREEVTAAFNLNLLERINRELGADFRPGRFRHQARYDEGEGRIEMHLVSTVDQCVRIGSCLIPFEKGETIFTESCYKYALDQFDELARSAGWRLEHVWTDPREWFSVQYLTVA